MLFKRIKKIPLHVDESTFKQRITGKHINIHNFDFEVAEKPETNSLKIYPHTENDDRTTTLPITDVTFGTKDEQPLAIAEFHMRSIDRGLPTFFILLFNAILLAGIICQAFESLAKTGLVFIIIGIAGNIILYFSMTRGYFDYIKKIKNWLETQAM